LSVLQKLEAAGMKLKPFFMLQEVQCLGHKKARGLQPTQEKFMQVWKHLLPRIFPSILGMLNHY